MSIRVLGAGLLTSVQDLGRHGHAAIGVGSAGAMDPVALRLANALAGNDEDAAALEITLRGPRLRFDAACTIALAGAELDARCGRAAVPSWRPVRVPAGAEIDFGAARRGVRAYLAIAGGVVAERPLGSRSSDINAGLGPLGGRALAAGDVIQLEAAPNAVAAASRAAPDTQPHAASWSLDPAPWLDLGDDPIALIRGAHHDRLDDASRSALFAARFRIDERSNRVGCRLGGHALRLREPLELVSEGVVPGTMQLPPGGDPIILMAEAPTTGGYPRIGHVAAVDLPRLAQRRPGERIGFAEISLADAQTRYLERERRLAAVVRNVRDRLGRSRF